MARWDNEICSSPRGVVSQILPVPGYLYPRADVWEGQPPLVAKIAQSSDFVVIECGERALTLTWNGQLIQAHGNQSISVSRRMVENYFTVWVAARPGLRYLSYFVRASSNALEVIGEPIDYPSPLEDGAPPSGGFGDSTAYEVRWSHLPLTVSRDGQTFHQWMERMLWTVGVDGASNTVILHSPARGVLWSDYTTLLPPRLALDANSLPHVAVSNDQGGVFLTLDNFHERPTIVAPYGAPKLIGTIWANSDRYGYHRHAGNSETFFEGNYANVIDKKPVIIGPSTGVPPNKILGVWDDQLNPIPETNLPVFRYWDHRHYMTSPDHREGVDVRLLQAYPNLGESPSNFEASMVAQLNRFPGRKLIVAAFYDRNGTLPIPELLQYMPVYDRLLRRPDVDGMLAFDYARSGILFHPSLLSWYNAFSAATPGLPSFPPQQEKPVSFKTTISHLVSSFPNEDFDNKVETRAGHTKGPWETVEITVLPNGFYVIKNNRGNEWLSVQLDGSIASRPVGAPGQPGHWEQFERVGNTLVERTKAPTWTTSPAGRPRVTFLVAGDL